MENIEAMLCAYIEGDLDASGRAEIEKHLRDHPQHRKLIDELIATRDMVRTLPRVQAPSDVGESLRGQVERSILLDDGEPTRDNSRLRINRWPQIIAVAAVFILVSGLAIILIKTLLPTYKTPEFMETASARRQPLADSMSESKLQQSNQKSLSHHAMVGGPLALHAVPPPAFNLAAVRLRLQSSGLNAQDRADRITPVYLVVNSPDPSAVNDKISKFLVSSDIAWTAIPQPALGTVAAAATPATMPAAGRQLAANNGDGDQADQKGLTTYRAAPVAQANHDSVELAPAATQPDIQQKERNNGASAAAMDTAQNQQHAKYDNYNKELANSSPAPDVAATQNQFDSNGAAKQEEANYGPATQPVGMKAIAGKSADQLDFSGTANGPAIQDIYHLARPMTPQQAEELRGLLAAQVGRVTLYRDEAADKTDAASRPSRDDAATQPADTNVAPGDVLQIGVSNIDLPAGTLPVQNLVVADDGTISPAGIQAQRVAGLNTDQIQAAVTKAYIDSIPGADPRVNVVKSPKQMADHELTTNELAKDQDGTSAVDVMIVIQKTAVSPAATPIPMATTPTGAPSPDASTQPVVR